MMREPKDVELLSNHILRYQKIVSMSLMLVVKGLYGQHRTLYPTRGSHFCKEYMEMIFITDWVMEFETTLQQTILSGS